MFETLMATLNATPWFQSLTGSWEMLPGVTGFTTSWIEIIITLVLGVNVFMCALNTKWNWPIGLVGVTLYGLAAGFLWGLYADAWLQVFYFATGVFGMWYWWRGGENKEEAKTTDLSFGGWVITLTGIAAGTYLTANVLMEQTDSQVPWMDAFTTITCLFAQLLLMARVRSSWLLWILADVVYIYLFITRGLNLLAIEYAFFTLNAVFGYWMWTKHIKANK